MDTGKARKLPWRVGRVVASTRETESAQTIALSVPGWGGHLAGQHIELKLTAEDGYSAQRSYSLSRPSDGERIELTVQQISDGEVSPYLAGVCPGEQIEIRGPIGGWFVWQPEEESPVLLVAGGSGIVPLMSMLRQRTQFGTSEFRLVYSVRGPADVYYADELRRLDRDCAWLRIDLVYTRVAPFNTDRPAGRIDTADLTLPEWPPGAARVYVCGPTGFVESVTSKLISAGHSPSVIRTERFGPSG